MRARAGVPVWSRRGLPEPSGIHLPGGRLRVNTAVRMSRVDGNASNCGPSTRQMTLFGVTREMRLTNTRHPAVDLLDFGEIGGDYWEQPEVKRLKDVLVRMPHTFAFVQQDKSEATSEEETEETSEESRDRMSCWQTLRLN